MKKIYLASPLGFSPENDPYREKVKSRIRELGYTVLDPWEQTKFLREIEDAYRLSSCAEREKTFAGIGSRVGEWNERLIREAEYVLAILDGVETDSGTASEIGFASALGKRCYGLRTDVRNTGDFPGSPINLQLLHFIERSGGKIFRHVADLDFRRYQTPP